MPRQLVARLRYRATGWSADDRLSGGRGQATFRACRFVKAGMVTSAWQIAASLLQRVVGFVADMVDADGAARRSLLMLVGYTVMLGIGPSVFHPES